jgi:hypothetical protein
MSTKVLTIPQYAVQIKKKSRQSVLKAVKANKRHLLPQVISFKKQGRDYLLRVST